MTDRRILFFGDSFVAGAGDPLGLGWVGRAVAAAFSADLPLTPYNLGVRGQTSVEVAARWRAEAEPRLAAEAAFGLVVSVGANDAVDSGDGRPRVAPSRTVDALAGMLDAASALGLPAFVVGPPPLGEPAADARILALTDRFAELCGTRRISFVPVAELLLAHGPWRAEAAAGDGAHPGAEGYQALAEIVVAGGFLSWLAEQCLSVRPVDAQTRIHPA